MGFLTLYTSDPASGMAAHPATAAIASRLYEMP
jgi:hypothetical protein